eukprot:TRINITY_DN5276_c0_g1_i4.p1 TRINITY_DN5276_c0_g1~~TRINITY_DN5276_c0_g1_i4.p1  ORF type:complete len:166 (-),score=21.89 TRINITY_DN5276_c0_g1_i4:488-985(-)
MNKEKEQLLDSLSQKKKERQQLRPQLEILHNSKNKMEVLEQEYWHAYANLCSERSRFQMECLSLNEQLEYSFERLEKVRRTYVLNETYHIWHSGHFVTVNGFRLGKLRRSQDTEWNEVNAAWGFSAHLIYHLLKELDYTLLNYRIIPFGSASRIEQIAPQDVFNL